MDSEFFKPNNLQSAKGQQAHFKKLSREMADALMRAMGLPKRRPDRWLAWPSSLIPTNPDWPCQQFPTVKESASCQNN